MKRFFTSLVTFSLVEAIGRHPAIAAGVLTLLGVGGGAGIAMLTTPTITPFISANFNPNQSIGNTSNGLKPNGGTAGALAMPTGNSTGGYTFTGAGSGSGGPSSQHSCNIVIFRFAITPLRLFCIAHICRNRR